MNLLAEAVSVLGLDPMELHEQLMAGQPDRMVGLARAFEDAGQAARDSYERARRAHGGLGQAFTNDAAAVLDGAAQDRRAWELLGQGGDDLDRTAAVVKRAVAALDDAQASSTRAIDGMVAELNALAASWNSIRAVADPAALAALVARAVAAVRTATTAVQVAVDDYDNQLRRGTTELAGRFPVAASTTTTGTAATVDGGVLGDVGSFFGATLEGAQDLAGGALDAGSRFLGGVAEGAEEAVAGLGALIGYSGGEFGWDTAGTAWAGLGTFLGAAALYGLAGPLAPGLDARFAGGRLQQTLDAAGRSLVAADLWGKDNPRAAGKATFNILSAVLGTKGAGAGLRAGSTGARVAEGGAARAAAAAGRTFSDDAAAAAYGANRWNDYVEGLPSSQRDALRDYSREPGPGTPDGPTYREINGALRGTGPDSPEIRAHVAEIDKALAGRPLGENVQVVRGTGIAHFDRPPDELIGEVIPERGYLSTSIGSPAEAFRGEQAVLHLTAPEGTPAVWMERASDFGGSERELLLGRDLSYRVDDVKLENGQWQIYGEILPPR